MQQSPREEIPSIDNDEEQLIIDEENEDEDDVYVYSKRARFSTMETSFHVEETEKPPRLVLRDRPHHQSRDVVSIGNRHHKDLKYLFYSDWFHKFLRLPTVISMLLLISIWTIVIIIFAGVYMGVDSVNPKTDCGLGGGQPIKFGPAFGFSLETCTTVGYGLPGDTNAFFENCPGLQVAIYFQMLWSIIFNAFLLSFFFARIARCEIRSSQMLFSNKAIIRKSNNRWIFSIRVYDADARHPVVEAHVRLYALNSKSNREFHTLRLLRPNDDLGGVLFTSIPTTIKHHIDAYSPLSPPIRNPEYNGNVIDGCGMTLREVDAFTCNRDGFVCPVCGESYGSYERLVNHIKYTTLIEAADENIPIEGSHQMITDPEQQIQKPRIFTKDEIISCLKDTEIICVVEGIEPLISGTFQALHSYTIDDIVIEDAKFAPCVLYNHSSYNEMSNKKKSVLSLINRRKNRQVTVDLDDFHKVIKTEKSTIHLMEMYDNCSGKEKEI